MVMALRLPSWQAEGCRRTVLKVSIHDVCCATSLTTPGPQARLTFAAVTVGDRRSASVTEGPLAGCQWPPGPGLRSAGPRVKL